MLKGNAAERIMQSVQFNSFFLAIIVIINATNLINCLVIICVIMLINIFSKVRNMLKNESIFEYKDERVSILSGTQEGSYLWVSIFSLEFGI